jgi:hypothetical protein
MNSNNFIRLNLGCGEKRLQGYINVDKYGNPDIKHDLETFPWPWEDNSVNEILLNHVLEHLGETTDIYFKIIKEIYRICGAEAEIHINVPHPRHDYFINDPSHVRIITDEGLSLFSKTRNREWIKRGCANSPLGLYLNVDFEIIKVDYLLDPLWREKINNREITEEYLDQAIRNLNNIVEEIRVILKAVK